MILQEQLKNFSIYTNKKLLIIMLLGFSSGLPLLLTLSDPSCVKKHRSEFEELIKKHIDILFANEFEAKELCQTQDLEESAKEISNMTEIAAVTRSEKVQRFIMPRKL